MVRLDGGGRYGCAGGEPEVVVLSALGQDQLDFGQDKDSIGVVEDGGVGDCVRDG